MKYALKFLVSATLLAAGANCVFAQLKSDVAEAKPKAVSRVTKVDDAALMAALKPNGKPLVVNFWATWCAPCIEEYPDLVKIDEEYGDKIDLVTVSLDDVADIDTGVPDFLKRMKAEMPVYLLVSQDETALIAKIRKDWSGGLPFTVIYGKDGSEAYFKEGKFKPDVLRAEIDKTLGK